jgi:hypothetical protein
MMAGAVPVKTQQLLDKSLIQKSSARGLLCGKGTGLKTRVARWYIFQTKDPNSGKFWMAIKWKMFVYFMVIWNILQPLGVLYGILVYGNFVYLTPFLVYCAKKNMATPLQTFMSHNRLCLTG